MFILLLNATSPATVVLSLLVQLALQLAGLSALPVLAANLALVVFFSHPATRTQLFILCRRWLLDGQARRRAARSLTWLGALGGFVIDGVALGGLAMAVFHVLLAIVLGPPATGWFSHGAMLAGCSSLVLLIRALRGHWPMRRVAASAYALPTLFLLAGVLVGVLVLCLIDQPRAATSATVAPSLGRRFAKQLLNDGWFCLSICWPLLLATAIIVLIPTGMVEELFPEASAPARATAQQLKELQHFVLEERHFLAHSLLTTPCAICLERFRLGEHGTLLGCKHVFHRDCLLPWVSKRAATCPTCRAGL